MGYTLVFLCDIYFIDDNKNEANLSFFYCIDNYPYKSYDELFKVFKINFYYKQLLILIC